MKRFVNVILQRTFFEVMNEDTFANVSFISFLCKSRFLFWCNWKIRKKRYPVFHLHLSWIHREAIIKRTGCGVRPAQESRERNIITSETENCLFIIKAEFPVRVLAEKDAKRRNTQDPLVWMRVERVAYETTRQCVSFCASNNLLCGCGGLETLRRFEGSDNYLTWGARGTCTACKEREEARFSVEKRPLYWHTGVVPKLRKFLLCKRGDCCRNGCSVCIRNVIVFLSCLWCSFATCISST